MSLSYKLKLFENMTVSKIMGFGVLLLIYKILY